MSSKKRHERREKDKMKAKLHEAEEKLKLNSRNLRYHKNKHTTEVTPKLNVKNVKEMTKFLKSGESSDLTGTRDRYF